MTLYSICKPQSWMHRDFLFSLWTTINKQFFRPADGKLCERNPYSKCYGRNSNYRKKQKLILWSKKSDARPTSALGWRPRCRFTCMRDNDFLSPPFWALGHYVELRLLQGAEKSCLSPWYVTSLRSSWTCTKVWQTPAVLKAAGCLSAILSSH